MKTADQIAGEYRRHWPREPNLAAIRAAQLDALQTAIDICGAAAQTCGCSASIEAAICELIEEHELR